MSSHLRGYCEIEAVDQSKQTQHEARVRNLKGNIYLGKEVDCKM